METKDNNSLNLLFNRLHDVIMKEIITGEYYNLSNNELINLLDSVIDMIKIDVTYLNSEKT